MALQRQRSNNPLNSEDLVALEQMLLESGAGVAADIDRAKVHAHGLRLFVHSIVGLDREAAAEASGTYHDGAKFTPDQIHLINLIVNELTANGIIEPARRL